MDQPDASNETVTVKWPSGLRRQIKALVRKGVGSNPTFIKSLFFFAFAGCAHSSFGDGDGGARRAFIGRDGQRDRMDE